MTSTDHVSVGIVQITCRLGDRAGNLHHAGEMLSGLAGKADIACLPELFDVGYDLEALKGDLFDLAETVPGETTGQLGELARRCQLAIVAGVVERDPDVSGLIYDTVVLIDREGNLVGRYRKSHLYPAETAFFCSGSSLPVFEIAGVRVGVAICFEHAFPQIFTTLALSGAQVVFNPSAVPVGYGYLQDLRTRARAQDNQIFVAAVNHAGVEGGVRYCGQSQIADPRGDTIVRAPDDDEAVLVAELPLDLIANQRRQEPIFRGFRPDLYDFNAGR